MTKQRAPFWKRPKPGKRKPGTPLTERQLQAAKARAQAAGRRYPNLVDNAWAAQQESSDLPALEREARDEDDSGAS